MKDSILKGTGNSRYLKSSLAESVTWAEALGMLRNGTFPIDLNGINEDGFAQVGTPLNKANILTDELAERLELDEDATLLTFLIALLDYVSEVDRMVIKNDFSTTVLSDDGEVLLDENGNNILVNWKYKEE